MPPRQSDLNGRRVGVGSDGFLGSLSRFWRKSYVAEYVGFTLLLVGYLIIQFFVDPFHRMFATTDLRISFPYTTKERVPLSIDFIYALFIPLGVLVFYNWWSSASPHKHHVTLLGFAIAMILTPTLTDIVKNAVGRPRPDMLARCKPAPGTPGNVLVSIDVCTETDQRLLQDGWRSFPSGHSSFSFTGLGYVALYLAGQFRVFALGRGRDERPRFRRTASRATDGNGGLGSNGSGSSTNVALSGVGVGSPPTHAEKLVRGDLALSLVCLVPLVGAAMIAISRVQDYRHDVYDVCVGALLGCLVTYWSYRRYWPRLSSARCDEPYEGPPAAVLDADDDGGGQYGRIRDEEEADSSLGLRTVTA